MLSNYRLENIRIGRITGEINKGEYYVTGMLRNTRNRFAKKHRLVIFHSDDPAFVEAVRAVFPERGTWEDAQGNKHDWNGSNKDIDERTFDPAKAEKALANVDGEDMLLFPDGKFMPFKLPGNYVRKYSTDLGGHKEGEYVLEGGNGPYVDVITEVNVFVMMFDEATDQYADGWEPQTRAKSLRRTLIPLEALINSKDEKERKLVNPRYMAGATRTVPQDKDDDEINDEVDDK